MVTRRFPFGATTLLGVGRGQGGTRSAATRCLKQRYAPRELHPTPGEGQPSAHTHLRWLTLDGRGRERAVAVRLDRGVRGSGGLTSIPGGRALGVRAPAAGSEARGLGSIPGGRALGVRARAAGSEAREVWAMYPAGGGGAEAGRRWGGPRPRCSSGFARDRRFFCSVADRLDREAAGQGSCDAPESTNP